MDHSWLALIDFVAQSTCNPNTNICLDPLPSVSADQGRLQVVLNLVYAIIGAICLLVITIAGFRYSISHGDPGLITQSKNAIIYAVIGLIIVIAAAAITNFAVNWFA